MIKTCFYLYKSEESYATKITRWDVTFIAFQLVFWIKWVELCGENSTDMCIAIYVIIYVYYIYVCVYLSI